MIKHLKNLKVLGERGKSYLSLFYIGIKKNIKQLAQKFLQPQPAAAYNASADPITTLETAEQLEQPKFKSRFKPWIRTVALIVALIFVPEQVAQAVEFDWRVIWRQPAASSVLCAPKRSCAA